MTTITVNQPIELTFSQALCAALILVYTVLSTSIITTFLLLFDLKLKGVIA